MVRNEVVTAPEAIFAALHLQIGSNRKCSAMQCAGAVVSFYNSCRKREQRGAALGLREAICKIPGRLRLDQTEAYVRLAALLKYLNILLTLA